MDMFLTEENSNKLYHILKHDRRELVDFLLANWSYAELRQYFGEIHTKYPRGTINTSVLKELFTGEIGFESNKQEALYELPTKELILLICVLAKISNAENIIEHMAGMGLISRMLEITDVSLPIKTYDGNRWAQTLSEKKFCNVEKRLFLQDIIAGKQLAKTLNLIVWPCPVAIEKELELFLKHVMPYMVVIVGEIAKYTNIQSTFTNNKYKIIEFSVPQISFRDVITAECHIQKSSVLVAMRCQIDQDDEINITRELIHDVGLQLYGIDLKLSDPFANTDEEVIEEMKSIGYIHPLILLQDDKKELIISNTKLHTKKLTIPLFLKTIEQIRFWIKHNLENRLLLPKACRNEDKFIEYYNLVTTIETSTVAECKSLFIIPNYITTKENALKYIWLDYSTNVINKSWKESLNSMNAMFRRANAL